MSALFLPLLAYCKVVAPNVRVTYTAEQYCYFELAEWQSALSTNKKYAKVEFLAATPDANEFPDIVFFDNNPCVNRAEKPLSTKDIFAKYQNKAVKIIVVDTTSAMSDEIEQIKRLWRASQIPYLVLAESCLKMRQFGLDSAQFGSDIIFVNQEYLQKGPKHQAEFMKLKQVFAELASGESSVYSTVLRRALRNGAIAITQQL